MMTDSLKMASTRGAIPNNDDDDEYNTDATYYRYNYTPPSHTNEFLKHLESVKSSWPNNNDDGRNNNKGEDSDNNENLTDKINEIDKYINADGGVFCTGEPSIDPSRMLNSAIIDGESNWI